MSTSDRVPVVVGVAVLGPHLLRLLFDDGVVRDLSSSPGSSSGTMIAPLDDPDYFALVRVDPEAGTIVWPNGLDLAPEVLHGDHHAENSLGFSDVTPARQPA